MRRFFGAKSSSDDTTTKPIKANMGKKLDMYYNTELNRWVVRGAESQALAEMAEKGGPPPAPVSQLGPPSPLPSNAKQGVPFWVKPSAPVAVDHRRIQSFQPYHPRALHQLHPAQPDEPPGNEAGGMSAEMGFGATLPPRGRLAPSPSLGAARSSSAMPMNPHMSPSAARPRPSDASIPDVNGSLGHESNVAPSRGQEPPFPGPQQLPTSHSRPFEHPPPRMHEQLPPSRMTQPPPQLSPPQMPGSSEYVRRDSVQQDNLASGLPPRTETSEGLASTQHRGSVDFAMLSSASVPPINDGYSAPNPDLGGVVAPALEVPPAMPTHGGVIPDAEVTGLEFRPGSVSVAPEPAASALVFEPPLPLMPVAKTPVDSRGRASMDLNNASVDEGSTQMNTSPQARTQLALDASLLPPPPPSIPDVGRNTLPPLPGDGTLKFGASRQSRAPSNSHRSAMLDCGPVVVMRRASRSRIQHRSPPISRRGTLKSDACDLDSPGRAQPVVTFDRVAFRSKYSNTIQTLDEIFCSLLEIYAVEARKIGKTASQSLLQHFDRLRILLPGSRSATQAEKLKNLLSSVDTDTETKSSDRPSNTGLGETLLTRQAEFMVKDLEEGLRKQQNALEDLQQLQSRIIEVAQVDGDENVSQEQQVVAEKWRQTMDVASRDLAEIRNEIEEITCLSSSLLGQRRMAEESFQLSILQIGREVEDHFTQVLKPKVQEIIYSKIATLRDEKEQALEQLRQAMEAQRVEHEKQLEEVRNQFEVDKIEFLNELDRKKDEYSQLSELREELEEEKAQFEQLRSRHHEEITASKSELNRLESYIAEQQNMLAARLRQCEEEEQRVLQMRQATEAKDADLAAERDAIAKEKVELAGERKFLEHEKRRIILVSKGLESRRSKLEAKQKQRKQISDTVSTGGGRVVLGSDGSVSGDGITETC